MTASPSLLLVEDDATFRAVLARSLGRRGFTIIQAASAEAVDVDRLAPVPAYAVLDLSLPGDSGLRLVQPLLERDPAMRIVVLTGYASIATAVEAIKLGATHYLTKPADADAIVAAFGRAGGDEAVAVTGQPIPLNRVEWEHIQRVLNECGGNISETARRLGMNRRTLQRKLQKRPSR